MHSNVGRMNALKRKQFLFQSALLVVCMLLVFDDSHSFIPDIERQIV